MTNVTSQKEWGINFFFLSLWLKINPTTPMAIRVGFHTKRGKS
jgi:hypothetical protein